MEIMIDKETKKELDTFYEIVKDMSENEKNNLKLVLLGVNIGDLLRNKKKTA